MKIRCHCEEGDSPTWQSPGTIRRSTVQQLTLYREIPTAPLGPRNDMEVVTQANYLGGEAVTEGV